MCSPCLGTKDVQIVRDSTGEECRMCQTTFVTFQWTPLAHRTRSTIICKKCAESNEACQSCIKDIKYHIDLPIRKTALRILEEEGGSSDQQSEVLKKVSERFGPKNSKLQQRDSKIVTLKTIIERFPLPAKIIDTIPSSGASQDDSAQEGDEKHKNNDSNSSIPANHNKSTLCVYGIEEDFDMNSLRSYLKASIEHIESSSIGRYAFISFSPDQAPLDLPYSHIIDGRRLVFAWGERVSVPAGLQRNIGAVVRAYLTKYGH